MLKFTCCDAAAQFSGRVQAQVLQGIQRGFEKECLRVDPQGHLAQTPHPAALGSKLTHPWITTDYSEALLEFITPPARTLPSRWRSARHPPVHRAAVLGSETMWASSMPCVLGDDSAIPLADYGSSNKARFKHVYREGLGCVMAARCRPSPACTTTGRCPPRSGRPCMAPAKARTTCRISPAPAISA
jgi:glutamate--cysteine ligase